MRVRFSVGDVSADALERRRKSKALMLKSRLFLKCHQMACIQSAAL